MCAVAHHSFSCTLVLWQTTNQETVFESCAKQLVEDVLQGYHGTIMTYGQVGSGKTFTMTGDMKVDSPSQFSSLIAIFISISNAQIDRLDYAKKKSGSQTSLIQLHD